MSRDAELASQKQEVSQQAAASPAAPDYRRVFESSPTRFLLLGKDPDFLIFDASDGYLEATHSERNDIVGRGLFEIFRESSREERRLSESLRGRSHAIDSGGGAERLRASLHRVLATLKSDTMAPERIELRRSPAPGAAVEVCYCTRVSAPVLSDSGELLYILHRVEELSAIALDETPSRVRRRSKKPSADPKSPEEDGTNFRKEAEAILRESEEHLRAVVETTPECVKIIAPDGTVLQMNRSGLEMVGAGHADEVVGRSVYALIAPEHCERFRDFHERVCRGERGRLEFEIVGLGGARRYMESHAAPLQMADGNTVQLALTRDITAGRQAEAALRESDRRKDEFIATLSHELRNPLAPLRNAMSILRLNPEHALPLTGLQEMMERQIDHLVRLVDDLLEMSRINRGVLELRRERVDLASIVRNAVEASEPLIRAEGHQLELELPPGPFGMEGDPVRLAQIFSNLLNNASRFTPSGGRITVVAGEQDGFAVISVRDSGKGFRQELAEELFEMFRKGDPSSGLGIGLSLARRLAEMHGGSIRGWSEGEGRGAEFVVRLPLANVPASADDSDGHEEIVPIACRVLIADDNRDAADSLARLLRGLGSDVSLAYDGEEAVELARSFHPDIALLDIGMPKLDGYEAARRIRACPSVQPVKLVALTGWGQDEDRRRSREAGFDEHLVKPAELGTLRRLLASSSTRR